MGYRPGVFWPSMESRMPPRPRSTSQLPAAIKAVSLPSRLLPSPSRNKGSVIQWSYTIPGTITSATGDMSRGLRKLTFKFLRYQVPGTQQLQTGSSTWRMGTPIYDTYSSMWCYECLCTHVMMQPAKRIIWSVVVYVQCASIKKFRTSTKSQQYIIRTSIMRVEAERRNKGTWAHRSHVTDRSSLCWSAPKA